jgi:hypothetical protein
MGQGYVKLKTLDSIIHFSPSLYLGLAFSIVTILLIIKGLVDIEMLTILGLTFSVPTAIFYAIQKSKLEFRFVQTSIGKNEFTDLVREISKEFKWTIHSFSDNEFTIKTNPGFVNQSWGQHITLKLTKDGILINSIFDTNKGTWLITFGSNTKNTNDIIKTIKLRTKTISNGDRKTHSRQQKL